MPNKAAELFIENITVSFDGFKALDLPYFSALAGSLQVLIGPNGAGKTTFCDIISGKTKPDTGRVLLDGKEITHLTESSICRLGVGRKFQTPTVFDQLTVWENLELALPSRRSFRHLLFSRASRKECERIKFFMEKVNLYTLKKTLTKMLSHGQRQWLEICMLLVSQPKLLLIDEPAAGLTDSETALTADLLLELKSQHTLIVIEHDMEFVRRLDSPVTVLNAGTILAQGTLSQVSCKEEVVKAYLGRGKI